MSTKTAPTTAKTAAKTPKTATTKTTATPEKGTETAVETPKTDATTQTPTTEIPPKKPLTAAQLAGKLAKLQVLLDEYGKHENEYSTAKEKKDAALAKVQEFYEKNPKIAGDKKSVKLGAYRVSINTETVVKSSETFDIALFAKKFPTLVKLAFDTTKVKAYTADANQKAALEAIGVTTSTKEKFSVKKG